MLVTELNSRILTPLWPTNPNPTPNPNPNPIQRYKQESSGPLNVSVIQCEYEYDVASLIQLQHKNEIFDSTLLLIILFIK